MDTAFLDRLRSDTQKLRDDGLYKAERVIETPQRAQIGVGDKSVTNLCANNYLGLADNADLIAAAKAGLDRWGFGLSSVRFICGTQGVHKELERKLSAFLGTDDAILYSSCFDANGGLFETILGEDDAVISDALNHASIIDGVRLCKAQRYRYNNNDMADLEQKLVEARAQSRSTNRARTILVATDGVFSMDGIIANLKAVCDLADKYGALTMVDDSHAVGFVGERGRGTPEHCGVAGRVDIVTGTLGKALGGASGGYTAGRREIVEWLRQRSRPYLFSNTLAPSIAAASIKCLELLDGDEGARRRKKVKENGRSFRAKMEKLGYELVPGEHAIIPVMLGDAKLATTLANRLLELGVYVVGFSYPVVPMGQARIRTQMSAAHDDADLDRAVAAFETAGRELGVIK